MSALHHTIELLLTDADTDVKQNGQGERDLQNDFGERSDQLQDVSELVRMWRSRTHTEPSSSDNETETTDT
jgi:hypothetical protein